MAFIKSLLGLDSYFTTREGTLSCPCGAVKLILKVPPSSYALFEQTCAICHCKDCVSFATACSGGKAVLSNNGTQLVGFYKSDIVVSKGKDCIGAIKLYEHSRREHSPMVRCYCTQCGTPLGADLTVGPVTLLYPQLITGGTTMPIFLPNLVFNYASAVKGTRPYYSQVSVRNGFGAPKFIMQVILRVIWGHIMGKVNGGLLDGVDYSSVPVGIDKIKVDPKKDE